MALERIDVEKKYKWDLSAIYESAAAFDADCKRVEGMIAAFTAHEGKMNESAGELLATLKDMAAIEFLIEKLWTYAYLGFTVDTSDNAAQALVGRVRNLAVSAGEASWFVSPSIIRLDPATVDGWYKECPELESFRRSIDKGFREKPHTLSDECEKLLTKMDDCLGGHSNLRGIFANSDLRFGKMRGADGKSVELTDQTYVPMLMSSDRRVRQSAFRTLYKTYDQFGNTFATMLAGYIKERTTLAKVRLFENSITASTFSDEVTPVIYNSLITAVSGGLSVLYDYYDLKREVLGLEKLHLYDVYAPLIATQSRKYSYEEAVDEVLKTVEVYGGEYADTLRAGLCERGWVDVYPTRGKRGGAFSAGCAATEPYILLNYNGTYNDMSTLAHEAGHSMHSYFSRKYNEPHNSSYTIFVAEVASTVNELLLAHRKLRESRSRDEKLYILNQLMETYKSTLYRQTMFAEFERELHAMTEKGMTLTADLINKTYYGIIKKYFGPRVACDKQIAMEWMRIPHFFSAFYVYKYATCISAASAIVKRIETEGAEYVGKYIEFLKCGGSRSPIDSLLVAGIDMRSPEVVSGAIEDFASTIAEFKALYNEKE